MCTTSSRVRIRSSRTNGALSRGPKTAAGKLRSSGNRCTHGLFSKRVVLKSESQQEFDDLRRQFIAKFHPQNDLELGWIEEMAAAKWRSRRIWITETRLLTEAMDALDADGLLETPMDATDRLTAAFSKLARENSAFQQLPRLEGRYQRQYSRALDAFIAAQNQRSNPLNETLINHDSAEPTEMHTKNEDSNLLNETLLNETPPHETSITANRPSVDLSSSDTVPAPAELSAAELTRGYRTAWQFGRIKRTGDRLRNQPSPGPTGLLLAVRRPGNSRASPFRTVCTPAQVL